MEFKARTLTLTGGFNVKARVDDAFPLFSPQGERRWVPGWNPEVLDPPADVWQEGQVFRTRDDKGTAVWVVARLDRERHLAVYHRVDPTRYVARVAVRCRSLDDGKTAVVVEYSYVGLSEEGNLEIAAMTQAEYDAKLTRWSEWIERMSAGEAPPASS